MDWYNRNVTGKAADFVNQLYANGIDPLRSAEGRAAVAQFVRSMPIGDIAKVKQSAAAAKEYIKNRGILEASGKWDPNFEKFANQGMLLEDWDTVNGENGIWNRTSPAELKTLKELTEPWYNQRTAHMLDKAGVESFGLKYDPRYDYLGFTNKDMLEIAAGQTPGWNGSIYADYYRDLAKKKLQAIGVKDPTAQQVENMLQKDIAFANREYLIKPTASINQLYLQDLKNRQARAIAAMRRGGGSGNNPTNNDAPTTFMDRLWDNVAKNFDHKQFSPGQSLKTLNGIVSYWDKMAKSVENKGKLIKTVEVDGPLKEHVYFGGSSVGAAGFSRVKLPTKETKKIYDNSQNKLYAKYMYEKERWLKFANGEYEPSKYDKSEEAKVVRSILKKGRNASASERAFVA